MMADNRDPNVHQLQQKSTSHRDQVAFEGRSLGQPDGRVVTRLISCPGPGSTGLTLVA